jgi:DNA polymerase IV
LPSTKRRWRICIAKRELRHRRPAAHEIDSRKVVPDREAKSISHETTFKSDITDRGTPRAWLLHLTEQVAARHRRFDLRGTTVQIKVRYSDFHSITRAESLRLPTTITHDIWDAASRLLADRLPNRPLRIRLLGIGVSGFPAGDRRLRSLFQEGEDDGQSRLDESVDRIRERFGRSHFSRGGDLRPRLTELHHR